MLDTSNAWAHGEQLYVMVYRDGVEFSNLDFRDQISASATYARLQGSDDVPLLAGQRIEFVIYQGSGGAINTLGNGVHNFVSIKRTGNYA